MEVKCPECGDSTEFDNEASTQICGSCSISFELVGSKSREVQFTMSKRTFFEAIMLHENGSVHSLKDVNKDGLQRRINNWLKDDWQIQTVKMTEVSEIQLV